MDLSYDVLNRLNLFTELKLKEEILTQCTLQTFEKDDVIVRQGQFVKVVPIVVSGLLKVYQTREDRQILLYHVEEGQTCMMSLSACFYNNESPSQAVATEQTVVLTIPTRFVAQWQKEYTSWNNFVIKTFRNRYDELLSIFSSVTFDHIDKRVLQYLKSWASKQQDNRLKISHQQLANELGTTRVVISRILKQFELDGIISLGRGSIAVV
jgi:CRP/FNR family transcriptional regulator